MIVLQIYDESLGKAAEQFGPLSKRVEKRLRAMDRDIKRFLHRLRVVQMEQNVRLVLFTFVIAIKTDRLTSGERDNNERPWHDVRVQPAALPPSSGIQERDSQHCKGQHWTRTRQSQDEGEKEKALTAFNTYMDFFKMCHCIGSSLGLSFYSRLKSK